MQNSIFKTVALVFIVCIICVKTNAQTQNEFKGNVRIKSSCLLKVLNGFYSYILDKKNGEFNTLDYYVRINISSTNDSTDYLEISLYSYVVTSLEKNPNHFYGYLKRNNIYFVFSTSSRLIIKESRMNNPQLFKVLTTPEKSYPKPSYDPYRWEFVICKNKILQKIPSEVIEKYVAP